MTPLLPSPRAAEEFDQVLDGTRAADERHAQLLDTVEMLRNQPEITPRAEFVSELRARLMTVAVTELVPTPSAVRPLTPRRTAAQRRRLGTVAASLVIVGGGAGMAAAASGALPGEPLYPIKRGIEHAQAAVHLDQAGKGATLLDQARTRLDEVGLLRAGSGDPALVEETLRDFQEAADSGSEKLFMAYQSDGEASHIQEVRSFTTRQMAEITVLTDGAPVTDPLLEAADTLADIDEQARVLCKACAPQPPVLPPDALSAGAGAPTVDTLLARPVSQARADIVVARGELDASIRRLQAAAERSAGEVPTSEQLAQAAADARQEQSEAPDRRVSSTITPEGGLLPTLTSSSGTAVNDLVTGVTATAATVTERLPETDTGLDTTLGDLTSRLDEKADTAGR